LLRKWLYEREEWRDVLGKPVPCHGRDKALRPSGIEGYVATAASRPGCRAVLAVFDGEGDPVCELGPALLARAAEVTGKPVAVCLADPKFEAWFVASAESLELEGLTFRTDHDPVGLVRQSLGRSYVKPTWQPRLANRIDFGIACERALDLARLVTTLDGFVGLIDQR
jgi:hypothetical protein